MQFTEVQRKYAAITFEFQVRVFRWFRGMLLQFLDELRGDDPLRPRQGGFPGGLNENVGVGGPAGEDADMLAVYIEMPRSEAVSVREFFGGIDERFADAELFPVFPVLGDQLLQYSPSDVDPGGAGCI